MLIDLVEGRRLALRDRQHLVGPGACLRLVALGLLLGDVDVLESGDDLGRRIGLLQLDALDQHAGLVGIEHRLHAAAHVLFDPPAPRAADDIAQRHFGHRGAHGGLGHFLYRGLRVVEPEMIELQVLDVPAHQIGQVDQIAVAGQHQFLGLVIGHRMAPDRSDVGDLDRFDRPRQRQRDARADRAAVFAESGDDALFLGAEHVADAEEQPDQHHAAEESAEPSSCRRAGAAGRESRRQNHHRRRRRASDRRLWAETGLQDWPNGGAGCSEAEPRDCGARVPALARSLPPGSPPSRQSGAPSGPSPEASGPPLLLPASGLPRGFCDRPWPAIHARLIRRLFS